MTNWQEDAQLAAERVANVAFQAPTVSQAASLLLLRGGPLSKFGRTQSTTSCKLQLALGLNCDLHCDREAAESHARRGTGARRSRGSCIPFRIASRTCRQRRSGRADAQRCSVSVELCCKACVEVRCTHRRRRTWQSWPSSHASIACVEVSCTNTSSCVCSGLRGNVSSHATTVPPVRVAADKLRAHWKHRRLQVVDEYWPELYSSLRS